MGKLNLISGMWYLKAKLTLNETVELARKLSMTDRRYSMVAVRPVAQERFGIYIEFVPPKNADLALFLRQHTKATAERLDSFGFPSSGHDIGTPMHFVKRRSVKG